MAKKTLAEKELEDIELVFNALAHPTRRHILIILRSRGDQVTGDIVQRFPDKWPTISRHLRLLENAGLITVTKKGRQQIYALDKSRLHTVINSFTKWF
jgi:DNA-binding transcriptional ArsR family regulator